jgi:hypothetical protein
MSNSMYDSYSISEEPDTTETFRITFGQKERKTYDVEVEGVEKKNVVLPSFPNPGGLTLDDLILFFTRALANASTQQGLFPTSEAWDMFMRGYRSPNQTKDTLIKWRASSGAYLQVYHKDEIVLVDENVVRKVAVKFREKYYREENDVQTHNLAASHNARLPGVPRHQDKYNRPQKGPSRLPSNPQARYGQTGLEQIDVSSFSSSNPAEILCAVHLRPGNGVHHSSPVEKGQKMSVTMVVAFLVKNKPLQGYGSCHEKTFEVVPHTVGILDSILKKGTNNILSMRDRENLLKEALVFRETATRCPSVEVTAYMEESNVVVKQTMVGIHPLASVTAPVSEPCFDRNTLTWKTSTCDPDIQRMSVFCPLPNPADDEDEAFKKDNEKYLKMKKDGAGYKDIEKAMKGDGKTNDEFKRVWYPSNNKFSTGIVVCGLKVTLVAPEAGVLHTRMSVKGNGQTLTLLRSTLDTCNPFCATDFFSDKHTMAINREWWGMLLRFLVNQRDYLLKYKGFTIVTSAPDNFSVKPSKDASYTRANGTSHPALDFDTVETGTEMVLGGEVVAECVRVKQTNNWGKCAMWVTKSASDITSILDALSPDLVCASVSSSFCVTLKNQLEEREVRIVARHINLPKTHEHSTASYLVRESIESLKSYLGLYNSLPGTENIDLETPNGIVKLLRLRPDHPPSQAVLQMPLQCDQYGNFTSEDGLKLRMRIARGLLDGPSSSPSRTTWKARSITCDVVEVCALAGRVLGKVKIEDQERLQRVAVDRLIVCVKNTLSREQRQCTVGYDGTKSTFVLKELSLEFPRLGRGYKKNGHSIVSMTYEMPVRPLQFASEQGGLPYHVTYPAHARKDPELCVPIQVSGNCDVSSGIPYSSVVPYSLHTAGKPRSTVEDLNKFAEDQYAASSSESGIVFGPVGFHICGEKYGGTKQDRLTMENFYRLTQVVETGGPAFANQGFSKFFLDTYCHAAPKIDVGLVTRLGASGESQQVEVPCYSVGPSVDATIDSSILASNPWSIPRSNVVNDNFFANTTVYLVENGKRKRSTHRRSLHGKRPRIPKHYYDVSKFSTGKVTTEWTPEGIRWCEEKFYLKEKVSKPRKGAYKGDPSGFNAAKQAYKANMDAYGLVEQTKPKRTRTWFKKKEDRLSADEQFQKNLLRYDVEVREYQNKIPKCRMPWRKVRQLDINCPVPSGAYSITVHGRVVDVQVESEMPPEEFATVLASSINKVFSEVPYFGCHTALHNSSLLQVAGTYPERYRDVVPKGVTDNMFGEISQDQEEFLVLSETMQSVAACTTPRLPTTQYYLDSDMIRSVGEISQREPKKCSPRNVNWLLEKGYVRRKKTLNGAQYIIPEDDVAKKALALCTHMDDALVTMTIEQTKVEPYKGTVTIRESEYNGMGHFTSDIDSEPKKRPYRPISLNAHQTERSVRLSDWSTSLPFSTTDIASISVDPPKRKKKRKRQVNLTQMMTQSTTTSGQTAGGGRETLPASVAI